MSANRDAEATAALREMLAKYPQEPGVHYLNGLHVLANDPDAAMSEFQKELQISPNHVPSRLQMAIIDIRQDKAAGAVPLAQQAVRLDPENALAHAVLGRAEMQEAEYAKALPHLQAAAKLTPSNPQIHLYLQQVYSRLGRAVEANQEKAEFLRLHSAQDASASSRLDTASDKP